MLEIITIVVLCIVSLIAYFLAKKYAGINLNPFGLILIWPMIIAVVNGWSALTKWIGFILVLFGIYLLAQRSKRIKNNS